MQPETFRRAPSGLLLAAVAAHVVATLVHFVHNAVFLADYPNLPVWLTAGGVYASWAVLTAIGIAGLALLRRVSVPAGLGVLVLYALLGFGGFDHYTLAAIAAHTTAMNLTILFEAMTGSMLLAMVVREYLRYRRVAVR
jgi:purine-cytosine permease-like protein